MTETDIESRIAALGLALPEPAAPVAAYVPVVIAGGLGQRIRETLQRSGFAERFRAKGRYEALMAAIPVKIVTHDQPGLFGAAAAFAREHGD
mgnify:CR=1 FL=1